ncbi:unnamed protein product [Closterium sp. NIES-53]
MLWVDKHRPATLDKITVHCDTALQLKQLVQAGDCPHLLFFGPSGAGKKTLVLALLREMFGPGADKVKVENKPWKIEAGTRKLEVELTTVASNHHVELSPSDAGFQDRYVVQEIIKDMALDIGEWKGGGREGGAQPPHLSCCSLHARTLGAVPFTTHWPLSSHSFLDPFSRPSFPLSSSFPSLHSPRPFFSLHSLPPSLFSSPLPQAGLVLHKVDHLSREAQHCLFPLSCSLHSLPSSLSLSNPHSPPPTPSSAGVERGGPSEQGGTACATAHHGALHCCLPHRHVLLLRLAGEVGWAGEVRCRIVTCCSSQERMRCSSASQAGSEAAGGQ